MKIRIAYLIAVPATLLFTQCAEMAQEIDAEVARENAEARNAQHNNKKHRSNTNFQDPNSETAPAYGVAFEKGRADAMSGKSHSPERYSYIYSEADRSDFFSGYKNGYNVGRR